MLFIVDICYDDSKPTCIASECYQKVIASKNDVCYCSQHLKSIAKIKPIPVNLRNHHHQLNKLNKQQLIELVHKYPFSSQITKKTTKKQLLEMIETYKKNTYYDEMIKINASTLSLITVSRNITKQLHSFLQSIGEYDTVIIENQMKIRMKCIQSMIIQYFIMLNPLTIIHEISAVNKLKDFMDNKIKTEYESGIHSFFSLSYEWVRNARNSVIDNLLSYDSSNNLWYSFFNLSWSMSYPNLKPQNRRVFYSIRMVQ